MKKHCEICGKELDKQNHYTERKTYICESLNHINNLWTTISINGAISSLCCSSPIKPMCTDCAISVLKETIKLLEENK